MKPFLRALGPDLQKDLVVGPFERVNIFHPLIFHPLMCHLLEISPEPNDFNLDITARMTSSAQPEGETTSIFLFNETRYEWKLETLDLLDLQY